LGAKIIDEVKKGAFAASGELVKKSLASLAMNMVNRI
jgi:hypothetical protein